VNDVARSLQNRFSGLRTDLQCPEPGCGALLVLRESERFEKPFYGCSAWPQTRCAGTHGAHPDGSPLGIPADQGTKAARVRAHDAFDAMWKGMGMRRDDAYRWLSKQLGLTAEEAHIGRLSIAQCEKLIAAVDATLARGRANG
jgi:hypothetical protein